MHASDGWINMQAMFISQRCASCCRSAVLQRSRSRHRLPPVHRLPSWGDLWREQTSRFISTAIFFHHQWERHSSDYQQFLSEPSSARYYSTPPLATVWSNYQTIFDDFFEVYFTKMVTLSPNVQTDFSVLFNSVDPITWSTILRSDWSITSQLTNTVTMTISM